MHKPDTARRGGDLFIVDNSDTEWKVRDIESSFSFVTQYQAGMQPCLPPMRVPGLKIGLWKRDWCNGIYMTYGCHPRTGSRGTFPIKGVVA